MASIPTDFHLHYDLDTCTDPLIRLGIHGLYRLLHYAGKPERAHIYPALVQSDTLSWTLTDTTIDIRAKTPADLATILKSMFGAMPHGIIAPPGYCDNPDDDRYYLTGRTHTAITSLFPNQKSGRTRSLNKATKIKFLAPKALNGVHPDDVGGLEVVGGHVFAMELVEKLKPNTEWITVIRRALRKDGSAIELKVSPHCPDAVLGKSILFASLPDQMVRKLTSVDERIDVTATFHPLCGNWNGKSTGMSFKDAYALYFAPYGYVYTQSEDGLVGVGLDFPTFSEADSYHKAHFVDPSRAFQSRMEGFVYHVHGNAEVTAFVLLGHLDCPAGNYSVIAKSGENTTAWDFYYQGEGKYTQDDVYGKFRRAIDAGMETEDAKGCLRVLRHIPLFEKRTAYDQVYHNLAVGMDWHHDLGRVVNLDRPVMVKGKKGERIKGPFLSEKEALSALVEIMQDPKEKLILTTGHNLFYAAVKKYQADGYAYKNACERAHEYMVTVNLARAVGKDSLLNALWRVVATAEFNIPKDAMDAIHEMACTNPRGLKNLLILGSQTLGPKKPVDPGKPEGAPSDQDQEGC